MRVHFLRPLCLKKSLAGALSSYKLPFFQETCHEMSFWEIARAENSAFFTQNAFGLPNWCVWRFWTWTGVFCFGLGECNEFTLFSCDFATLLMFTDAFLIAGTFSASFCDSNKPCKARHSGTDANKHDQKTRV